MLSLSQPFALMGSRSLGTDLHGFGSGLSSSSLWLATEAVGQRWLLSSVIVQGLVMVGEFVVQPIHTHVFQFVLTLLILGGQPFIEWIQPGHLNRCQEPNIAFMTTVTFCRIMIGNIDED